MVIKGKARGGASALAAHLQRRDTNEHIRLHEFEGVTARDVLGALREMDAMGSAAASRRTLYHAAINSAPDERMTDDQKRRAVECLADELGLKDQPRIVVEHTKKDRDHMHVVFLRIDTERMVAIPDSHNYRKHEVVARALEHEFGHSHVQGAHVGREGKKRPDRTPGHDEMQQAERSKIPPAEAKKQITALWHQADSGRAFVASVTAEGWVLAKGDRRDFVLIDHAGETHSLRLRLDGMKAADIRQRMNDVDTASLPTVQEAKARQRSVIDADHSKDKEDPKQAQATAVEAPKLLRVEAKPEQSPAHLPLQLQTGSGTTAAQKEAATVAHDKTAGPEQQTEASRSSKPGRVKRIYDAATARTRSMYDKARSAFDKKPIAEPRRKRMASSRQEDHKPVEALTPPQRDMRGKRETARAGAQQQMEPKAIAPPPNQELANDRDGDRSRDRDRGRSRNISEADIQQLLDRQRRQREIGGPSR